MRKFLTLVAATALFCVQAIAADDPADCSDMKRTNNNFFGMGQLQVASTLFEDTTAVSLLGEVGPRNYRGSGTFGAFYDCHRVKVGGEYLGQKLAYEFCTGEEKHWVQQYAVGGRYEYVMPCEWLDGFFIDGSSSFAHGKELPEFVSVVSSTRTTIQRQLREACYYNIEAGVSIAPWECGNFLVGVGFNEIRYGRDLADCKKHNKDGVSVDLEFTQRFCQDIFLDITAEFRQPYTYVEGLLDWTYDTGCGMFTLGVFGGYVWGRDRIPNSSNAGVSIGFNFGPGSCCQTDSCYASCCNPVCSPSPDCQDLIAWVNRPAVYMPIVLADPDQDETVVVTAPPCTAPKFHGTIVGIPYPGVGGNIPVTAKVKTRKNFSGSNLKYTLNIIDINNLDATINPKTGVVTLVYHGGSVTGTADLSVTATNSCGTATSNVFPVDVHGP